MILYALQSSPSTIAPSVQHASCPTSSIFVFFEISGNLILFKALNQASLECCDYIETISFSKPITHKV